MRERSQSDVAGESGLAPEPPDTGDFRDDSGRRQLRAPLQGYQVGGNRADSAGDPAAQSGDPAADSDDVLQLIASQFRDQPMLGGQPLLQFSACLAAHRGVAVYQRRCQREGGAADAAISGFGDEDGAGKV